MGRNSPALNFKNRLLLFAINALEQSWSWSMALAVSGPQVRASPPGLAIGENLGSRRIFQGKHIAALRRMTRVLRSGVVVEAEASNDTEEHP
jgi:hypothetical protein